MKKSPRTWNRRDFNVVPNGLYTVLKSAGWFSAWRLPAGFRYRAGQLKKPAAPQVHDVPAATFALKTWGRADRQQTAILSQSIVPSTRDRRPLRLAIIVLAATAIAVICLWWFWRMTHAGCYYYCN
jgi:hypothetical protein